MITAGMAAARPHAVARSASAMPGATTARFVVWAFEMPMKLFMMPQTVPNRPTNGEVAPMVASKPIPCPPPGGFGAADLRKCRGDALLDAAHVGHAGRFPQLMRGVRHHCRQHAAASTDRQLCFRHRRRGGDPSQRSSEPPAHETQL